MHDQMTLIATFDDGHDAERAIERLRDAGFDREQVGFAANDPDNLSTRVVEEHGNAAGPGAVGGLVTGAAAGGVVGWLGLAAIPAVGPFLAGGAIGSALIAGAAGGVTGGLLGGLLGLGVPRHEAEEHEEQVRQGRTLVSVRGEDMDDAESILRDAGAADLRSYRVEAEPAMAGRRADADRR